MQLRWRVFLQRCEWRIPLRKPIWACSSEREKVLCASQNPKSAQEIEKEQEAKLKAKYNNIGAKKKLMPKVVSVQTSK